MTTAIFISSLEPILKNDGNVNAGGTLTFYVPGTTNPKAVYSDNGLTTSLGSVVTLSSAGTYTIFLNGNYDLVIRDSAAATVRTIPNINPITVASSTNITTPTTLDETHNSKWITTTANLTLPTSAAAGTGWQVHIKNLASTPLTIIRGTSGDTLNGVTSNLFLPGKESVSILNNSGLTGFNLFFNPLIEIGVGIAGQVVGYGSNGPEWQSVDLINAGNDLYLYNNFT